ncbi:MAG: phosphoribosylglycinamide synthetase C domain-containing protein, partial [Paracoccaceae bacterium]
ENGRAQLIDYNARFGDPETQVLMLRLGAQVLDLLLACAERRLDKMQAHWANDHALTVVVANQGYPGPYKKGAKIGGLDMITQDSYNMVFHAGTEQTDGEIIATGGRVLAVTARGITLQEAQKRAYDMVNQIDWPTGFYRRDIGWRALIKP